MAELNETIHQPVRLRIMAALVTLEPGNEVDFTYLRDLLEVTDGNLGAHLRKLEEAGYIAVNKTFVERKPRTFVSATAEGRKVFQEHVAALEVDLEKQVRKDMNTIVQVEGLRKIYGATVAVDEISFEVSEGEIFGMVGPNGAGKTTTIECLEGLRKPDAGNGPRPGRGPAARGPDPAPAHRDAAAAVQPAGPDEGLGGAGPVRLVLPQSRRLEGAARRSWGWRRNATPPSRNSPAGRSSACSSPWRSCRTRSWSSWTS